MVIPDSLDYRRHDHTPARFANLTDPVSVQVELDPVPHGEHRLAHHLVE